MTKMRLGELSAIVTGGTDGHGGGDGPALVLLHGFGAPGTDLVPIAEELGLGSGLRCIFPMAPIVLEPGALDDFAARAWWMIDIGALQTAMLGGRLDAITNHEPAGLAGARAQLESLLDAAERELSIAPDKLVIGGFSQGAMLATDTVLSTDRAFAGLAILSGMLIREREWSARAPLRRGLPVFQSHGRQDPILPFAAAVSLAELLRAAGLASDFTPFDGGHGIPARALERFAAFVQRTSGAGA